MKILGLVLFIILLAPACFAELVEFKYDFKVDFQGERKFEIVDANDNTLYKHFEWTNATTPSDDEFTVRIYRDINSSCQSLTEMEVLKFYNSIGYLANNTIECNDLWEAHGRVITKRDQLEEENAELENETKNLESERDSWESKYNSLKTGDYQNKYSTCNSELEETKGKLSSRFIFGALIGAAIIWFVKNQEKKELVPSEIQEAGYDE